MGTAKGPVSRAHSVHSRSTPHDILKRRDRPYRSEKLTIYGKKRKLQLQNSYQKNAPPGYTYMPIGTPELAEKCKELSRLRDYPVYVVNTAPTHANALNAAKVSAHVHRHGYHFKEEIVADACDELDYQYVQGKFRSKQEIETFYYQNAITQAMAKRGLRWDGGPDVEETPERVKGAIKELFPRIPETDLEAIVQHSWQKGSDRVGTNASLDLPRRVQLAVIARIRHAYTDYDAQLKAFGTWREVRQNVEPDCLAKLLEWRGDDQDDDGQFEQMVRETIILDDDNDLESSTTSMSETDSDTDREEIRHRGADVVVSHRLAVGDDLRPEEPGELKRFRRPQAQLDNIRLQPKSNYRIPNTARRQVSHPYQTPDLQPAYSGPPYAELTRPTGLDYSAQERHVRQNETAGHPPSVQNQIHGTNPDPRFQAFPEAPLYYPRQPAQYSHSQHIPIRRPVFGAPSYLGHYNQNFPHSNASHVNNDAERPIKSIERVEGANFSQSSSPANFSRQQNLSHRPVDSHPPVYSIQPTRDHRVNTANTRQQLIPVFDVDENRVVDYIEPGARKEAMRQQNKIRVLQAPQVVVQLDGSGESRDRPVSTFDAHRQYRATQTPRAQQIDYTSHNGSPEGYDPRQPLLWPADGNDHHYDGRSKAPDYPYASPSIAMPSDVAYATSKNPSSTSRYYPTAQASSFTNEAELPASSLSYTHGRPVEHVSGRNSQAWPSDAIPVSGQPAARQGEGIQMYPLVQRTGQSHGEAYYPVSYPPKPVTSQPIHGAPAAVQQLPRPGATNGQGGYMYGRPHTNVIPAPVNGAPAPTQYYVPR